MKGSARAAGWWDTAGVYVSFADTVADVGIFQVSASASTTLVLGVDNMTLSPCLFSDGFESGGTDRWSSVTP